MKNSDNKGFIYIFSKSDQPDLIKVGKSTKNPILRAEQLSKQTSASGQFKVEWYMEVPDIDIAENICHFRLKEFHYNKEYFKIQFDEAKQILTIELVNFFKLENSDFTVFWRENKLMKASEVNAFILRLNQAKVKAKELLKNMKDIDKE